LELVCWCLLLTNILEFLLLLV